MSSFTVTESSNQGTALHGSNGAPSAAGKSFHVNANAAPWVPGNGVSSSSMSRPFSSPPPPAFHPHGLPAATFSAAPGQHGSMYAGRFTLCPAFLEHGFCEGHNCPFAHTFDDLHPIAQTNLLVMLNLTTSGVAAGVGRGAVQPGFQPGLYAADGDSAIGPTIRRFPSHKPSSMNASAVSSHSQHDTSSFSGGVCPPSPESQSDISSVSSASGHGTALSHQQPTTPPCSGPASPSSLASAPDTPSGAEMRPQPGQYGLQPSPFIKSQMYYSQAATRVTLPERCRFPHATPGTYYDYLNVKRTAVKEEIVAKYQQWRDEGFRKANAIDSEKALAMDRLIVDAKNILSSDGMRAAYDALLPPVASPALSVAFGAVGSCRPPQSPSKGVTPTIQPIPLPSSPESIW